MFTSRCLGNPICPLRPRSELPSRPLTMSGGSPHCGVSSPAALVMQWGPGVHGGPGTTWWQSPHGAEPRPLFPLRPEGRRECPGFRLRKDLAITVPLRGQYAPADGPQFPCLYSGTRCLVRVFQPLPSCSYTKILVYEGYHPGRLVVCGVRVVQNQLGGGGGLGLRSWVGRAEELDLLGGKGQGSGPCPPGGQGLAGRDRTQPWASSHVVLSSCCLRMVLAGYICQSSRPRPPGVCQDHTCAHTH